MLVLVNLLIHVSAVLNNRPQNEQIQFHSYSMVCNKCMPIIVSASASLTFIQRLSTFTSLLAVFVLAVLVCGRFGVWPFWTFTVAVLVSFTWPFRSQPYCSWPFWFVAVLDAIHMDK